MSQDMVDTCCKTAVATNPAVGCWFGLYRPGFEAGAEDGQRGASVRPPSRNRWSRR